MADAIIEVEDDDDFLAQVATLEADALSSKRRKTTATTTTTTSAAVTRSSINAAAAEESAEGAYTAALRGSRSLLFQQQSSRSNGGFKVLNNNNNMFANPGFAGGGGTVGGGGVDSCFKCGKSGHWSRDCDTNLYGVVDPSVPEKACPCGLGACIVLTANTEKNRGRQFYKCPLRVPHFFHFDLPEVGTEKDERLGRKLKLLGLYIQGVVLRQTGGLSEIAADTPGLESDMRDAPTQTVEFDPSGILDNGQCEFVVVLDRFPNPAYTPKFEDVFQWSSGDPRTGCMVRGTEIDCFVVLRHVSILMPPQSTEYSVVSRQGVKTFINIGKNVVSEFRDSFGVLNSAYNNIVKIATSGDPRTGCMVRGTEIDRFVVLRHVSILMPPQSTEYSVVGRQGVKTFINIGKNVVSEFRDSFASATNLDASSVVSLDNSELLDPASLTDGPMSTGPLGWVLGPVLINNGRVLTTDEASKLVAEAVKATVEGSISA
ncbi:hypothetical protein TEA_010105 [Camellia sinensis var. sinensis]|uniref:Uncharacterized protein n=1 Tax=Camellia sinensis var. sinensis TaxID=542762 RepID=A0A4S4DQ68_CAMSN|nr:hypothetical protein TEA_010105 [Camellia sinensis var. sinensis]